MPRMEPLELRSLMTSFIDLGAVTLKTINSTAEAIGWSSVGAISPGAPYFRDSSGVMHIIGSLPGDTYSDAVALNDSGEVVGSSGVSMGIGGASHAFLYSQGTLTDLGTLAGDSSSATAINDSGRVVGNSSTASGAVHAFLWGEATGMQDLTDLGFAGAPTGINNAGQIIVDVAVQTAEEQPVFWGGPGDLTHLPTLGGVSAEATAINDSGDVVGSSATTTALHTPAHAFLLSQTAGIQDLGTLNGFPNSSATSINNSGIIVGSASAQGFGGAINHAFMYSNGQMTDLNTFPGVPSGWVLNTATAINDNGVVAGMGTDPAGQAHGYLLYT